MGLQDVIKNSIEKAKSLGIKSQFSKIIEPLSGMMKKEGCDILFISVVDGTVKGGVFETGEVKIDKKTDDFKNVSESVQGKLIDYKIISKFVTCIQLQIFKDETILTVHSKSKELDKLQIKKPNV